MWGYIGTFVVGAWVGIGIMCFFLKTPSEREEEKIRHDT